MKIAIAGFGLEGKANYDYFQKLSPDITIVDEKAALADMPAGVTTILGDDAFAQLADFDLVVRSAGVAPRKITTKGKIWSATNEFFEKCPAPIIGVTGTKGKGTTASLIASILQAAGKTVHLLGNIGVPALTVLPEITTDDIVVFELSSFQLWDLERSPHVAVVLMIEPDHLNVHTDFNEYVEAKANIRRFQTADDICIYHPTNPISRRIAMTGHDELSSAQRFAIADDGAVYVKSNTFFVQDTTICPIDALQLPGLHNQENACAAISAALRFTDDYVAIEQGLRDFEGLPHRLKFVREINDVQFYDDSIATTPGSAIAALDSFGGRKVIILGGSNKGSSYQEVLETCKRTDTFVVAVGQTGEEIYQSCLDLGIRAVRATGSMRNVVAMAYAQLEDRAGTVLLSPASASFDQYENYSERGDQFIAAVNQL